MLQRLLCLLLGYLCGGFLTAELVARARTGKSAAALGTAGWLYDAMLLDQCKFPLPLRLCLELLPFLPYAGLAFLAIPAFGFTGFYTVILLIGALAVDLLLARLLRLILGTVWIPSAVSGLLLGIFAAFAAL